MGKVCGAFQEPLLGPLSSSLLLTTFLGAELL